MSHIVQIQTEVRDAEAVKAAARRLGLDEPIQGTFRLFDGEAIGMGVRLPGWLYYPVFDLATGQVRYDNYGGQWGEQKHLDAFIQAYAIEKAKIEARKRGHSVYEQPLADGSIKLVIQVAGGASLNKTIEITISPKGETRIETKGFSGAECRVASQFVEQALGRQTSEQLKGEFYNAQQAGNDLRQSS